MSANTPRTPMLMRFYQVPVLLTQPTKKLNLVRNQICLFVELIPH